MEGECLLRIEDLDTGRSRPEFEAAIRDDLDWLGLRWPEPVLRQSENLPAYAAALDRLAARGLAYPCSCTRADIRAAAAAPQEGTGTIVYPGTCRGRSMSDMRQGDAVRLDLAAALATEDRLDWLETGPLAPGRHVVDAAALAGLGDVVLARRDIGAAYHLAVVVDDAAQGVTHVVRGADLLGATPLHRLLQALLGLDPPVWHHHELVRDDSGRRLAKRDNARSLATLRAAGTTPADVRRLVGLSDAALAAPRSPARTGSAANRRKDPQ